MYENENEQARNLKESSLINLADSWGCISSSVRGSLTAICDKEPQILEIEAARAAAVAGSAAAPQPAAAADAGLCKGLQLGSAWVVCK